MEKSGRLRKAIRDFTFGINGFSDGITPTREDREKLAIRIETIFGEVANENNSN